MTNLYGFLARLNPVIMLIQYGPFCVALFFYKKNEIAGASFSYSAPTGPHFCQNHQQRHIQLSVVCWKMNKMQKVKQSAVVMVCWLLCACFHPIMGEHTEEPLAWPVQGSDLG